MKPSAFYIYNASAGSGKTYALVKEYLQILLLSSKEFPFKHVLAITFTNKAVAEMKERILDALRAFSESETPSDYENLMADISEEINLPIENIKKKSKAILDKIVHNYAAFDISTIDRFTQKLIRAFAYDLRLPVNFDVSLDTETIIVEAIDNLIAKAGTDSQLTQLLIDFAIEKADEDKSFNIEYDFKQIAKLLINENDFEHISNLRSKSLQDFKNLSTQLKADIISISETIIDKSKALLNFINECSLEYSDFSGGYLPKHFDKLAKGVFEVNFNAKWQENIESKTLFPTRVSPEIGDIINNIQPEIAKVFYETKQHVINLSFKKAIYRNLTPLSLLNEINKEVQLIKEERNLLLISEFNAIVSQHLIDQPAPFIYERIGEKFKHYFIDEFQDTSVMQWQNIIPLIDNALAAEDASLLLVGDAKQAIYRWRGGKAEQFMQLFNEQGNPFYVKPSSKPLNYNYRSYQEIVDFNNGFFKHLSSFAFSDPTYSKLFANAEQKNNKEENGCVSITFLDTIISTDLEIAYCKKVHEKIVACLENGFHLKDICILVRKKKEGVAIAKYLTEETNIDIISSETLLLSHSPEVNFIIDLFKLLLNPNNKTLKISVLVYLQTHKLKLEDSHQFFADHINLDLETLFIELQNYEIYFDHVSILTLSLYEAAEKVISDFKLAEVSDAYIQFFLDEVIDFTNKRSNSFNKFISYYEQKKDSLSITSSTEKDAVQIMTIHKSKGLEFPVVIFPFADLNIYKEQSSKVWFPIDPKDYNGFNYALLNYNKQLQEFGEIGEQLYLRHRAELELDNINLLYVALTRPVEQLHIVSHKQLDNKGNEKLDYFSGLFINYLKKQNHWNNTQLIYQFGEEKRATTPKTPASQTQLSDSFITTPLKELNINIATKAGLLWDSKQEEAIEKGNLLHLILSKINTKHDVSFVFNEFLMNGSINDEQNEILKKKVINVVQHPELLPYFSNNVKVYNEREIITESGKTFIPDRIVFLSAKEIVLIDYKTGAPSTTHEEQIYNYKLALEKMDLAVKKMILIYINDSITIKEV